MSSRSIISARQRTNSYKPNGAIASHVNNETQLIDSRETVIKIDSPDEEYWVGSSKFVGRYYHVAVNEQGYICSATDERVAAMCISKVQAYQASLVA
jgi:hypothetical protein